MKATVQPSASISDFLMELRFKPNPLVLDVRGEIAQGLTAKMSFPHWQVQNNRIDVQNDDRTEYGFVGFRNCGYGQVNPPTPDQFAIRASKLVRVLHEARLLGNIVEIERLGVRVKFLTDFPDGFDELRSRFADRYIQIQPAIAEALGGRLVDVGALYNFVDSKGNFNTTSGPMIQEQMKEYIDFKGPYPEVALYFDVDYFWKGPLNLSVDEITRQVKEFVRGAVEKQIAVARIICFESKQVQKANA
jgi:hypothetical protein